MDNNKDLRVIKTRESLQNAFFELLEEKSFNKIKVKDVCEKAKVNRATFYDHFTDKHDLYYSGLDGILNMLIEGLEKLDVFESTDSFEKKFKFLVMNTLEYIETNKKKLKSSLSQKNKENSIMFENVLREYAVYFIKKLIKREKVIHSIPEDILASFYSGAFSSVVIYWIKSDSNVSKEELSDYIINLENITSCRYFHK